MIRRTRTHITPCLRATLGSRTSSRSRGSRWQSTGPTQDLATFASELRWDSVPETVVDRTKELFADFFCCALAGRGYPSLAALESFARDMGPSNGSCEIIAPSSKEFETTSPFFSAMLNAAAGHIVEQDDLHNSSVVHPGTVVFPAALAAAQGLGSSGKEFLLSSIVGYEVACRVGEMLGTDHYRIYHTTGTAGTLGASAAVASLLRLPPSSTLHAFGTAGTQSSGLWEFASDAAMSKQIHTAHAASIGLMSAYTARDGLEGARDILLGSRGMAKGMAFGKEDPDALCRGLGKDWKITETSFKYWASCRHTHPSADALLTLIEKHNVDPVSIKSITAHVYQAALDVLRPAEAARTVHESKFSMGFVLATVAVKRSALLNDFTEASLTDPLIRKVQKKVTMVWDKDIQEAYPQRWLGHVELETMGGEKFEEQIAEVKGDPGKALTRNEIKAKGRALARFGGGDFQGDRLDAFFDRVWELDRSSHVTFLR